MNHSLLRAGTLAVLILLAGAAPAHAAWPGHNGRILFDSGPDDGGFDVFTINKKGGDLVNLTANSPFWDGTASWRPDGGKIVFVSGRATADVHSDIFIMDPDGSHVRQLTHNLLDEDYPAWAPDGQSVLFLRDLDPVQGQSDEDLFALDLRTGHETNLTHSPGNNEEEAVWSPDGKQIAYMSDVDGDAELYLLTVRTGAIRKLTNNTADDEFPDFSPDGQRIVFNSDRSGNFDVWTMRANGSDLQQLTNQPLGDVFPVWSPNGRKIAFASKLTGADQIWTMRADGSHKKQLTTVSGDANVGRPDWQPH